ncbi:MAG: aminoglycoside phosphotransferase family protein [Roseibium sp.]|uniref:phosphotransferase n=1 Tax=Roseibium sp. TaxID=1936156 RepID=UPI0026225D6B|nr:phosphotransferase [Roseibium sp.]MCV0428903.1 aminoglycoside phosphotransferase family protein [Roseibium sp.]
MRGMISASRVPLFDEANQALRTVCVVKLASGLTVDDAVKRFSALGAQFEVIAEGDGEQTAAVINWGGRRSSIPVTISEEEASEWLLEELSREYAQLIAPPHHDVASLAKALRNPRPLNRGADSYAIWYLETNEPMVLKVGSPDVIELETSFFGQATTVSPQLFPRIWSSGDFAGRAWYLMEAGKPDSGEELVFSRRDRLGLDPDWIETLVSTLVPLAELYRGTVVERTCKVARYHYTERILRLLKRDDFRQTAAETASIREIGATLRKPLRVNGMALPAAEELVEHASRSGHGSVPRFSTMIHGDLHLKNMVATLRGRTFILLDPRLQWDCEQVDRFAYGDPVYDMATLLHSVGGMAPILRAIETDTVDRIVTIEETSREVQVNFSTPLLDLIRTTLTNFPKVCIQLLPAETMGPSFPFRLYAGAANATFGWLKYKDAVKNEHAWWAIYALASIYLDAASGRGVANA